MTSRARKIPELPEKTSIGPDDLFVLESVIGSSSSTCKITGANVLKQVVSGPYDDDSSAEVNGIQVGQLYYTSSGNVKVRLV